ncbi:MAG: hypothetical protein HYY93_02465 [Planctomycetes bacterium]|nr:hypothetical protein [Planctomycetota bacterium]
MALTLAGISASLYGPGIFLGVAFDAKGERVVVPARSEGGQPIPGRERVTITKMVAGPHYIVCGTSGEPRGS